jgi:hypothetical protein
MWKGVIGGRLFTTLCHLPSEITSCTVKCRDHSAVLSRGMHGTVLCGVTGGKRLEYWWPCLRGRKWFVSNYKFQFWFHVRVQFLMVFGTLIADVVPRKIHGLLVLVASCKLCLERSIHQLWFNHTILDLTLWFRCTPLISAEDAWSAKNRCAYKALAPIRIFRDVIVSSLRENVFLHPFI